MSCEYFDCIHSHGCFDFKSNDCELCHNNYDACSYCKHYEEKDIEKCLVKGDVSKGKEEPLPSLPLMENS